MTAEERDQLIAEGRRTLYSGNEAAAIEIAKRLLQTANADAQALELFGNALASLQDQFSSKVELAIAKAPTNQLLRVVQARWLAATGRPDPACRELRSVVAESPNMASAWVALIQAASARDRQEALRIGLKAIETCPGDAWIWRQVVLMLSIAGEEEKLARYVGQQELPALDHPDFLRFAWLLRELEFDHRIWKVWEQSEPAARESFLKSSEAALLLSTIARERASPGDILQHLLRMLGAITDLRVLRQGFELAVLMGDLDAVNRFASELHRLSPRDHGLIPMYLLNDARIFSAAMVQVQEAMNNNAGDRLHQVSKVMVDEPASLPAAMAWCMLFRAEKCQPRPHTTDEDRVVPSIFWAHTDLRADWRANLANFKIRDLRDGDMQAHLRARMPRRMSSGVSKLPPNGQMHMMRWEALSAYGGWSIDPYGPCQAPVERVAINRCTLVTSLSDRGLLAPELLAVTPGHAAIDAVRGVAFTATLARMRGGGVDQAVTGGPALTLGVANWGASLVSHASPVPLYLLTYPQRQRLLGVGWPT